jgi:hypothetical protein
MLGLCYPSKCVSVTLLAATEVTKSESLSFWTLDLFVAAVILKSFVISAQATWPTSPSVLRPGRRTTISDYMLVLGNF